MGPSFQSVQLSLGHTQQLRLKATIFNAALLQMHWVLD